MAGFDLPIDEVKGYINDLMDQIGEDVVIDYTINTKVMIADLEKIYSNLQQNMKQLVLLYDVVINRGSRVDFADGKIGIVYIVPNDDIVSKSTQIVLCNCDSEVLTYGETYNTDPNSKTFGDVLTRGLIHKSYIDGFIERLSAKEKQFDVGLLHDSVLRLITFQNAQIALEDILIYRNKNYKIIDIDDITEGILVVQLATVRK